MRLLIVEDDAKTSAALAAGFGEHGFSVDVADNGRDAIGLSLTGRYT